MVKVRKLSSITCLAFTGLTLGAPAYATETPTDTLAQEIGEHGAVLGGHTPVHDGEVAGAAAAATTPSGGVLGMDVSSYQPNVNWRNEYAKGARFSYHKVSEGTSYTNPYRHSQQTGAKSVGMFTGGYHFALPSVSSGAQQAKYFVQNGGGWSNDGKTLPGLLDVEFNPYRSLGNQCYNMSPGQMRAWIKDFTTTYKNLTGVAPAIYTNTNWWNTCVGNTSEFTGSALHIANYGNSPGRLPAGWAAHTIWQYSDKGIFAGDSNQFNGTLEQLRAFANTGNKDTPSAPKYSLFGGIGAHYYASGGAARHGEPLGNEFPVYKGGMTQQFSKNTNIYWSPTTGAYTMYWGGAIGSKYAAQGYERGWGFPIMNETPIGYGVYQMFKDPNGGRTAVYWSAETGAHTMYREGALWHKWAADGAHNKYGFPVTDEAEAGHGGYQVSFLKNNLRTIMYYHPHSGTNTLNEYGDIAYTWRAKGGAARFGYPSTSEVEIPGGAMALFKKDNRQTAFVWSAQTGTKLVNPHGALYHHWKNTGFTHKYGFPTADEYYDSATGIYHLKLSKGYDMQWTPQAGIKLVRI